MKTLTQLLRAFESGDRVAAPLGVPEPLPHDNAATEMSTLIVIGAVILSVMALWRSPARADAVGRLLKTVPSKDGVKRKRVAICAVAYWA
jgi:hypothetical protein